MSNQKLIGVTLVVGVAGVVLWLGVSSSASSDERPEEPSIARVADQLAPSVERELRRDLRTLSGEVAALGQRGDESASEPAAPTGETAEQSPATFEERAAAGKERDRQIVAQLDEQLSNEGRDAAWADETERSVSESFASGAITGGALASTVCGKTMCRFNVEIVDGVDAHEVVTNVLDSRGAFATGGHYSLDEVSGQLRFYVRREAGGPFGNQDELAAR